MVKVCEKSIYRPLELILDECLLNGVFPSEWKKGKVVLIHKKNDRQCLKEYCPLSLLLFCGKILERLIFNKRIPSFTKIDANQSGFTPGNS